MNISNKLQLPSVSVIIINYNGHRWFELFMNSLINTTYPDFEILVVDNGSTDQSIKYLNENFGTVKVVCLGQNEGFANAANIGAIHAKGDILSFINNDMEVRSDWLINAVTKLISDVGAAAVQCKILKYYYKEQIDCIGLSVDRFNVVHMIGRHEIDRGQYDNLPEIGASSGGAMLIWKHIFNNIGKFDPAYFMYYEDVDLSWRIRMRGFRILSAASSIVFHIGSATAQILDTSGEGNLTPFFAYHTAKNYLYCWLKNSSCKVLLIYWPVVLFIVLAKVSLALSNGKPLIALSLTRGILWNLSHLRDITTSRVSIKNVRKNKGENILLVPTVRNRSPLLRWIRKRLQRIR